MVKCPNCGYNEDFGADFCTKCGKPLPGTSRPSSRQLAPGEKSYKTAGGELKPWTIVAFILTGIGVFFTIFGFWIIGLPLMIAAGYFAYTQGSEILPRITLLLSAVALFWINALPENQLISTVGVAIAWMSIILMLPTTEKGGKTKVPSLPVVGIIATITTGIWTFFVISTVSPNVSLIMTFINLGLVGSSIVWKAPIEKSIVKLIGTTVCFLPLIIIGVNFMISAGLGMFGRFFDRAQMMMSQDMGLSGTALDMILNPQLAVQSGLKPATQKEVKETTGPPTLAFAVSGSVIPESGCYDDSSFQLIAKVTNTGAEFISDLELKTVLKKVEAPFLLDIIPNPCDANHVNYADCAGTWNIKALPEGVTLSKNCLIQSIDDTGDLLPPEILGDITVTPEHTCFFDIIASTGYHAVSRLPVEMIEEDYGRNKFEQRQLIQRIVPSTTSIGPVDLSLGGFEQPILHISDNGSKITMITTISQVGPGRVQAYKSAYLYIPDSLLINRADKTSYNCAGINDDWVCINDLTNATQLAYLGATNTPERKNYNEFLNFKSFQKIENFTQFEYDNSDALLNEGYSICFFKKDINPSSIITTGTCTLEIKDVLSANDLRKTLLIRGDVLYTYNISTPIGVTVRDCDV